MRRDEKCGDNLRREKRDALLFFLYNVQVARKWSYTDNDNALIDINRVTENLSME